MVGVDGSDTSLNAVAWAVGVARRQRSQLVMVYVESASGLMSMAPGVVGSLNMVYDEIEADLRGRLAAVVGSLGVDVEFEACAGDPLHELTRVADQRKADLVVVGASASAGHRVMGSVAVRLVRAGRWPVTVVP